MSPLGRLTATSLKMDDTVTFSYSLNFLTRNSNYLFFLEKINIKDKDYWI